MKRDYAKMGTGEIPFGCDGLSVGEIEILYRDGLKKGEMIGIIADLCATDRGKIRALLEARGHEVPQRKVRKGREKLSKRLGERLPEVLERLREIAASGGTIKGAAQELHAGRTAVSELCKENGIEFPMAAGKRSDIHNERLEWGRRLAAEGKTSVEAAKIMGVCKDTANVLAREGGYKYGRLKSRNAW